MGQDGDDYMHGSETFKDYFKGGSGDDLFLAGNGSNMYYGGAGADRFGLMKKHGQNVIADFDHSEGDQLLMLKQHIDSVEVSLSGAGPNAEP